MIVQLSLTFDLLRLTYRWHDLDLSFSRIIFHLLIDSHHLAHGLIKTRNLALTLKIH